MVIDGKPVRLLLRGDRLEAARWVPYFAGLCRGMTHDHEKQSAAQGGVRGWARALGGSAYEIYIEVMGGLRYYDVSGFYIEGSWPVRHQIDFFAWALPDAKLDMTGTESKGGVLRRGNSVHIGRTREMLGYFGDYRNSVTRVGRSLYTVYSANWEGVFGTLLFRSRDIRKDQAGETVLLSLPGLVTNAHAVFATDAVFLMDTVVEGVPRDFADCGQVTLRLITHSPSGDAGTVRVNHVIQLIDRQQVSADGGRLSGLTMVRGKVMTGDFGESVRVVYLSFFESYESSDQLFRHVVRINADTGAILASARVQLPNSLDSDARRIEGLIDSYISWQGEVGAHFIFCIGTLIGVSAALRVQTYDMYVLETASMALVAQYLDTGIAQLGVYADGTWAVDFRSAEFTDLAPGRRYMRIRGFMQTVSRRNADGVPVFQPDKDLAPYDAALILEGGNYVDRSQTEKGQGFIERYAA